jgi:MFS family permease
MVTVAHALVHLIEGAVPPLIPLLLVAFGANYFQMGLVVTVFAYAFGLGAFPAGILVDRIGPKRLLVIYLFGSAFFCLAMFFVRDLLFFGILLGFLGLLGSVYHPAANTLISLGIKEKGRAFGINGISGSLGTAAVPFLAAWLGSRMGWNAPHIIFGAAALIVGFYAVSVPSARREKPEGGAKQEDLSERKVNIPLLVLFFMSAAFAGMGSRGVLTFLPTYLGGRLSSGGALDAVTLGGISATVTLLAGALGQYVAGRLVDKHRPDKLYVGTLVLSALSVLLMAVGNGPIILAGALGFAFFSFGYQPLQNYMVTKLIPKKRHGAGYGIMFFMSFGVGSLAAVFSGYLADRFGLASLFFAMTVCYGISLITALGVLKLELRLPGSYL